MSDYDRDYKMHYDYDYYGRRFNPHTGKTIYVICPICNTQIKENSISEHIINAHADNETLHSFYRVERFISEDRYICNLCGERGHDRYSVLAHLTMAHSGDVIDLLLRSHTYDRRIDISAVVKETEIQLLAKLDEICEKLKAAGWKFDKAPAINADGRRGFILTALEPQPKENANVSESHSEPNRK